MDRIIGFIIFTTVLISCTFFSAELPKADPFEKGTLTGYDGKKSILATRRSVEAIVPNDNEVDKVKKNTQQAGSQDTNQKVVDPQKDQNVNRPDGVQIINKSQETPSDIGPVKKHAAEDLPKTNEQNLVPEDPMQVEIFKSIKSKTEKSEKVVEVPFRRKTQQNETQADVEMKLKESLIIEPLYVQALMDIGPGHNDSNPVWSPSGELIAFERSIGDKREIIVSQLDGSEVQKIYCRASEEENEMELFLPGIIDEVSYNSGISWSPDGNRLVFMSNGGSGNYDLYLLPALADETTIRLTEHAEKDSHPHWSPNGERLVFVSGRTGTAELYTLDLVTRKITQLTFGHKTFLYPQWSPDGKRIVMIYGSNENHDIYLIEDVNRPLETLRAITTWVYDDLRPVWSPDGKQIAFYSNYNRENNPKLWSIIVIAADGSDPSEGEDLAKKVVARNVIPDIERGPAWMPDNNRIIYVRNDEKTYNPIYIFNLEEKANHLIKTDTKMNHDVVSSSDGTFAFRAQVEQWDHIYTSKLKE
jgi:Tol biopolymer transport system component